MDKVSAKELREKLKALRAQHAGKAVGKMNVDEIAKEISHHETACRATELKAKRLEALASARKARASAKEPVKEEKVVKKKSETIGERVEKKKGKRSESDD